MTQKVLFDEYYMHYNVNKGSEEVREHLLKKRTDLISKYIHNNSNILDIGCGFGEILNEIKNRFSCNLIGVDSSIGMLSEGKRLYEKLNFVKGDIFSLPFRNDYFDMVFNTALVHHIHADLVRAFNEMIRVVKPGGHLIFIDSNPINPFWLIIMARQEEKGAKQVARHRLQSLLIRNFSDMMLLESSYIGFMPRFVNGGIFNFFKKIETKIENIPLIRNFCTHYYLVFIKSTQ